MEKFIWLVMENTDRTEGKGNSYPIAAFLTEEDASKAVLRLRSHTAHTRPLLMFSSFNDWNAQTTKSLREKALAKLTAEEAEALGLDNEFGH